MITKEELERAGYRISDASGIEKGRGAIWLAQKVVKDVNFHKKYFINFHHWPNFNVQAQKSSFSVEVYLYRKDGISWKNDDNETCFKVSLHVSDGTTLKEVEDFYEEMYQKMNCVPDLHNQ